jgi:arsenite-transporting ATPase
VGKTTVSSALAVELASNREYSEWNVLVVSTDPAHSLGDALDVDLRRTGGGVPTTMSDPLTDRRLHALEVDPRSALAKFQEDLSRLFEASDFELGGVSTRRMLEEMGLGTDELENLLRNPPPGLDEYVALANVLDPKFADEDGDDGAAGARGKKYDVIVVDTAPTGHTLRMLQLPQFLDGFLGTILALRGRLRGLASTLRMLGGGGGNSEGGRGGSTAAATVDDALGSIENFRRRASSLKERLGDPTRTKFVVVTIPTILGARESERLMTELAEQGMCVSDVVVNQCVGGGDGLDADGEGGGGETVVVNDSMRRYYDRRVSGQRRWISELAEACREVSSSEEYRGNSRGGGGGGADIAVTEVPFYDIELVGVPALGFLGSQTFFGVGDEINGFERLVGSDDRDAVDGARNNPRVVICGGKGGVGKTTTSSSLAIAMALAGHDVALVSTDPAHSLGDALDMNLAGGSLVDVPLYGVMRPPSMTAAEEGSLKAMEIDPASALREFRDSIDKLLGRNNDGGGPSDLSSALGSLGEIIDTLPAGADEVVALAKVIQLIRRGKFDRVVLDTAPTGHTLRMLTTPSFLADLIERVLSVAAKLNSNAAIKLLLSSAIGQNRAQVDDAYESAKSALLKFQVSMYDLEDMFADPDSTEFLIVTIGTELAVRESVRLLNDLTFGDPDMQIRVRNVVVNQVLDSSDEGDGDAKDERLRGFIERLTTSQSSSIREIRRAVDGMNDPPRVTKATMLDMEPRGVYGLKAMSEQLLQSSIKAEEFAT